MNLVKVTGQRSLAVEPINRDPHDRQEDRVHDGIGPCQLGGRGVTPLLDGNGVQKSRRVRIGFYECFAAPFRHEIVGVVLGRSTLEMGRVAAWSIMAEVTDQPTVARSLPTASRDVVGDLV